MGFRQWFFKVLDKGSDEQNPDEFVEIALVRASAGPMIVESLRQEGFEATGQESFDNVTAATTYYRVMVPRRESEHASAKLIDLM